MQKYYKPTRIAALFVAVSFLLAIYMTTLYKLQLIDTSAEANAYLTRDAVTKDVTLTSNRGDILDRNGNILVSSRAAYNITLSRKILKDRPDVNKIVLDLIHTAVDNNIAYTDSFPVTSGAPFAYVSDMTNAQKRNLEAYLKYFDYFKMGPDISASDLIIKMKEHYGIDYTMNIPDARLVIGVRYELELRAISSMNPYIFANDVSVDYITLLEQKHLPGINIETSAKRVYHTTYAAHVLGYIGGMSQDDYDKTYKAKGYSYNTLIGKDGAESAFEQYLHGQDGAQSITTSADGTVLNVETTTPPTPGNNVFLSIDIGLQAVCEDSLAAKIDILNATRAENQRVSGGAVVVTDVNTGEVLACASYPTYDPSVLSTSIGDLINNPTRPMFDRATQGTYMPGSTFKMVSSLAGLKSGFITPSTTVNDTGRYMKYADTGYTPSCWIYPETNSGHGLESVVGAIRDSCDYFFYWLGDNIGIRAIADTAADFGLGSKTGIELAEKAGTIATPEAKKAAGQGEWFAANNMIAAIGQDLNLFTPVQLANYVATIANGGTHYSLTILDNIRSADFSSVVLKPQPKVMNMIQGSEYLSYIQEGMREVASSGTASSIFDGFFVKVAAKTGTVQSDLTYGIEALNSGVFVCYAPADKPQIAISILVEKGTSGATIADISKDILSYYFKSNPSISVAKDNSILP